jgi:hypothetical protein
MKEKPEFVVRVECSAGHGGEPTPTGADRRVGSHLVQKVVKHKKRVVPAIDVFHHIRGQLVFFPAGAGIEEDAAARFEQ